MSITKYPLDFEELQKGDVITSEMIEMAMDCKVTDRNFNFKMMALGAMIEKATGFNVKSQNYTELRILTDEEGVPHSAKTFKNGLRKLTRAGQQARNIEIDQLSASSRDLLQRQMINQSRILQAVKRERRLIISEQKQRQLQS